MLTNIFIFSMDDLDSNIENSEEKKEADDILDLLILWKKTIFILRDYSCSWLVNICDFSKYSEFEILYFILLVQYNYSYKCPDYIVDEYIYF